MASMEGYYYALASIPGYEDMAPCMKRCDEMMDYDVYPLSSSCSRSRPVLFPGDTQTNVPFRAATKPAAGAINPTLIIACRG